VVIGSIHNFEKTNTSEQPTSISEDIVFQTADNVHNFSLDNIFIMEDISRCVELEETGHTYTAQQKSELLNNVIGIEDILKCVESEETGHTAQQKSKISVQMNEGTAPRCYLGGFVSIDPIHNSEETDMWTSEQSSSSSKDAVSQLQKGRTVVQMAEDPCITSQKLGCTNRKEKNCQESLRTTYKVVEPYKGKKDLASKSLSEAMTSKEEEYFENKFELLAKPGAPPYTIKEIIEESRTEIKYHGCRDLIYKRYRFWRKKKGLSPSGYKRGVITQQVRERIKEYCKLKREGHNVSMRSFHQKLKNEKIYEGSYEYLCEKIKKFEESDEWGPSIV